MSYQVKTVFVSAGTTATLDLGYTADTAQLYFVCVPANTAESRSVGTLAAWINAGKCVQTGETTFSFSGATAGDYTVFVSRKTDPEQLTPPEIDGTVFPTTDVIDDICRLIDIVAELQTESGRAIKAPEPDFNAFLPTADQRAGKIVGFDNNGDLLVGLEQIPEVRTVLANINQILDQVAAHASQAHGSALDARSSAETAETQALSAAQAAGKARSHEMSAENAVARARLMRDEAASSAAESTAAAARAQQSAIASDSAKTTAQTAADTAEAAATRSRTAADASSDSANDAAVAASAADDLATTAGTKAGEASASANYARGYADDANGYAQQARGYASDAGTYATQAEASAQEVATALVNYVRYAQDGSVTLNSGLNVFGGLLTEQGSVNSLFGAVSNKADRSTTISGYGITDAYTKTEIDSKLTSAMRYKGSLPIVGALPMSGNTVGDVWNILENGHNYAWDGTQWDRLSGAYDMSAYVQRTELPDFTLYALKSELPDLTPYALTSQLPVQATTTTLGTVRLGTSTILSTANASLTGVSNQGHLLVPKATTSMFGTVKLGTGLAQGDFWCPVGTVNNALVVRGATTAVRGVVQLASSIDDTGALSVPTAAQVKAAIQSSGGGGTPSGPVEFLEIKSSSRPTGSNGVFIRDDYSMFSSETDYPNATNWLGIDGNLALHSDANSPIKFARTIDFDGQSNYRIEIDENVELQQNGASGHNPTVAEVANAINFFIRRRDGVYCLQIPASGGITSNRIYVDGDTSNEYFVFPSLSLNEHKTIATTDDIVVQGIDDSNEDTLTATEGELPGVGWQAMCDVTTTGKGYGHFFVEAATAAGSTPASIRLEVYSRMYNPQRTVFAQTVPAGGTASCTLPIGRGQTLRITATSAEHVDLQVKTFGPLNMMNPY